MEYTHSLSFEYLLTFLKDAANSDTPGTVKNKTFKNMAMYNNLMHFLYCNQCSFDSYLKTYVKSRWIRLDSQTYTALATGQVKPGQDFQNLSEKIQSLHLYIKKINALWSDKIDQQLNQ